MTDDQASGLFDLIAGAVCLDFANTVGGLRGADAREYLHNYHDLAAWSQQARIIARDEADRLLGMAARRRAEAEVVFARAIALREAIYRIFTAIIADREPARADIAILNAELARATVRREVRWSANVFISAWVHDETALDAMLWHIARSAADLLMSASARLVRQCSGDTCGWLFVDTTRNGSRRWCAMRGCGNRAKVRRHRTRQRMERTLP